MNITEEIFKTNPDLLNKPEVKSFIDFVDKRLKKNSDRLNHFKSIHDKILSIVVNSEVMRKNGEPSKDCIKAILAIFDEND